MMRYSEINSLAPLENNQVRFSTQFSTSPSQMELTLSLRLPLGVIFRRKAFLISCSLKIEAVLKGILMGYEVLLGERGE